MYCSNCGNKIDENADVCLKCGTFLKKNATQSKDSTPKVGKGIASLVLGIIALFFCISAFSAFDRIDAPLMDYDGTSRIGFAVGFILIQTIFAVLGFCLAVVERANNKNGFNTAGFWLGIVSFLCIAIQFIFVLFH